MQWYLKLILLNSYKQQSLKQWKKNKSWINKKKNKREQKKKKKKKEKNKILIKMKEMNKMKINKMKKIIQTNKKKARKNRMWNWKVTMKMKKNKKIKIRKRKRKMNKMRRKKVQQIRFYTVISKISLEFRQVDKKGSQRVKNEIKVCVQVNNVYEVSHQQSLKFRDLYDSSYFQLKIIN